MSRNFCYAPGDESARFCGDPKELHCAVLGDPAFWASTKGRQHLVKCMRDDHFIHHRFIAVSPTAVRAAEEVALALNQSHRTGDPIHAITHALLGDASDLGDIVDEFTAIVAPIIQTELDTRTPSDPAVRAAAEEIADYLANNTVKIYGSVDKFEAIITKHLLAARTGEEK